MTLDEFLAQIEVKSKTILADTRDISTLLAMLRLAIEVLKDIKCGCGGRAKIFGEELKRCPTCASAERADEGLNELLKLAEGK